MICLFVILLSTIKQKKKKNVHFKTDMLPIYELFTVDRGSGKRKIKPTANQEPLELYDFVLDGGSSSDSDFRVEDHCESSSDESSCFSVDDGLFVYYFFSTSRRTMGVARGPRNRA